MMTSPNTTRGKISGLLQTNKLVIFLEILFIFFPFWIGLIISDQSGTNHISLGGNLRILGGPITYLGLTISLVILWIVSWLRGIRWSYFGLIRPKSWFRTTLQSLGVALAVLLTVKLIINPLMNAIPNAGFQDLSRFDYLHGDLPNLIIMLVNIWITAAFLEEFLFRGYLMNRLIDLMGSQTTLAWVIALVGQAIIFGLVHAYQSPIGMFKVGLIGLVFGASFLVTGRNLWPLILAHGWIDSLDMVSHYFGG
jgi:membrane protease YdiL (CAAX protease family)